MKFLLLTAAAFNTLNASPPLPMPYAPDWLPSIGSVHQRIQVPFSTTGDLRGTRFDVRFQNGDSIGCFWPLVLTSCADRFKVTLLSDRGNLNSFLITAIDPQLNGGGITGLDFYATTWYPTFGGHTKLLGRTVIDNQIPGDNRIKTPDGSFGVGTFGSGMGREHINAPIGFGLQSTLLDRFSEDLYGRLQIESLYGPREWIVFRTDIDVMWVGGSPEILSTADRSVRDTILNTVSIHKDSGSIRSTDRYTLNLKLWRNRKRLNGN